MPRITAFLSVFFALTLAEDPELRMDAIGIIRRWGYSAEEHTVITEDEYVLTIHRIPHGRSGPSDCVRPVVFMQHGLECSSTNWITNLPNESAAFLFADAGFDVWMGNFRGNYYSSRKLNPHLSDDQFWAFSWDEMALQDLPAMLNYVLAHTGQPDLYYFGHSMGTMTVFALTSTTHAFDSKIKAIYALGPVATVNHISGFLRFIAKFRAPLNVLMGILGMHQFLPETWFTRLAAETICTESRVPVYIAHTPSGTSTQNIVHFAQGAVTNRFQMFDYGLVGNLRHYGHLKPPEYNLKEVKVPVYLFYGSKDVLADVQDIEETLIPNLATIKGKYEVDMNHLDFIWGMQAAPLVYDKVLRLIADERANRTPKNAHECQ